MERNEMNGNSTERKRESGGCSCGCGGGNSSNRTVVVIWVVLLLGFACFVSLYPRFGNLSEADKHLKKAYELFERQDFAASAEHLKASAELGQPWGQLYYGGTLKKGVGVEQDLPAAVEWFRKSADQNCAVAFYELGVCYENGEGVEKNLDEAAAWYRKALEGGIGEEAQASLDRVLKLKAEDTPEARAEALYKEAIELFERQDKDIECAELLRQSAELGHVWAQLFYGRFLCKGIGTALDPKSAVEWFRKAADQNSPDAFYELGVCYENGEGVEKNLDEALTWYRKAVDGGFEGAQSSVIRVEKAKALNAAEKK